MSIFKFLLASNVFLALVVIIINRFHIYSDSLFLFFYFVCSLIPVASDEIRSNKYRLSFALIINLILLMLSSSVILFSLAYP